MFRLSFSFLSLLCLALSACVTPPTSVHQPLSARPMPQVQPQNSGGSIYQTVATRPLFEDRRARMVGDTLVINLVESTTASKSSSASASKDSSITAGITGITKLPGKFLGGLDVGASDANAFSGKGAAGAKNAFTGMITVTVIEVYPNGNLLVSGEKQIAINQGDEFIRFSGVINPANVTTSNSVQSTQVADARLEYKATGYIDEMQTMGWLQRFFTTILPL